MIAVKFCGINRPEAADAVASLKPDYAGFVFHPPSPRYITPRDALALKARLGGLKSVAVVVDAQDALLEEIAAVMAPDYIQLHGAESPERVRAVKQRFAIPVIKAIRIAQPEDCDTAHVYAAIADMLLFDAPTPGQGRAFDWRMLAGKAFALPWLLSGGLHAGNVAQAIVQSGARGVDVSSGIESAPGVKDAARMAEFMAAARAAS